MTEVISREAFVSRPLPLDSILLAHQLVLLPLYFFVPIWIAIFNSIAAVAVWYHYKNPEFQIARWLKVAVTALAIVSVFVAFRKFSGRDAGIALICAMYGLKILEVNTRRDANLILSLGFFMIVGGFLFSQKPLIALYQFIPVLAILNAFLAINSIRKFELANSSFGGVLKELGKYLLIAIPIMLILFVFFPRLSGPLWRMPGASTATTGVSDTMSFGEIISLQTSENVAFRVNFADLTPNESQLYWRVLVLDRFDGISWYRGGRRSIPDHTNLDSYAGRIDYTVTLEPTRSSYLVTLDRPLTSPKNGSLVGDYTAYSRFRLLDRTRYAISSYPDLKLALEISDLHHKSYTLLPSNGNEESREWAQSLRQSVDSDRAFIQAILNEINRAPFYYTLTPGVMEEDIIDSFWLSRRRGFCEHYAGTLAFLARAAGVPARVVIGYQGGEKNPLSDYWIVRDSNAHAWTEIWFEGEGWVRIDPTAAIAPHRIEEQLLQEYTQRTALFDSYDIVDLDQVDYVKQFQYWLDEMNNNWNDWVLDYNNQRQRQLFANWGMERISNHQLIIGMIILVTLFVLASSLKWFHRRSKVDPLSQAFSTYVEKLKANQIIDENENLGPIELARRLDATRNEEFQGHITVLHDYINFRYAGQPYDSMALKRLIKKLRQLKV